MNQYPASQHTIAPPRFRLYFLHPKFWLTWLMVIVLYIISWLPYSIQLALGRSIGALFYKIMKRRVGICERNLELAYPEKSIHERQQLAKQVFLNAGVALFETGIAWWWPDWRLKRIISVEGLELLEQAKAEGKGVLAILFHFLSLEVHARSAGLFYPAVGLYRPHNNAVMEYLQTKGRNRSNKYMIPKKDVKGMLNALNEGELAGYLPDQDYGRRRAVFIPLFAVPDAATTTGTSIFANHPNCVTMITTLTRRADNQGYVLKFRAPHHPIPTGDDRQDAIHINKELEYEVNRHPGMYMWMHRRFKTRPTPDMNSYYEPSKTTFK